jgi:hypothetical protein
VQEDREEPLINELNDDALSKMHEEKASASASAGGSRFALILGALVLLVVIGIAYFFTGDKVDRVATPQPPPIAESVAKAEPEYAPTPDIPTPRPPSAAEPEPLVENAAPVQSLATLDASDEPVREALGDAGSSELYSNLLANNDLIQRSTGVIDGMSRGLVLNKILPLPRPAGAFTTLELDGQSVIDPASYARYDVYAQAAAELDVAQLTAAFHSFRPLLEQAYAQMGYKAEDFDNSLIRALDQIVATPELHQTIPVKKKEAVYLYADPALEELSPLQKQLLRMGPDNLTLIKAQANALRAALLKP